jgi:hypothetical protein
MIPLARPYVLQAGEPSSAGSGSQEALACARIGQNLMLGALGVASSLLRMQTSWREDVHPAAMRLLRLESGARRRILYSVRPRAMASG